MSQVTEDALEGSCCGIPDFNAFGMGCDKGVEDWVVKHREAGLVICEMVVSGLIIVIETQLPATSYNSLGRSCN